MSATASIRAEPTLDDLLRDLWQARLYMLASIVVGLVSAVLFLAAAVPQYKISMLVAPTMRSNSTPDIPATLPDNASLAMEYVMQNFGPGDSSDFMRFETILRETSVAEKLLQDPKFREAIAKQKTSVMATAEAPKDGATLALWLQKNLAVEPVGQTRLKRIVLLFSDRAAGIYILNLLYLTADDLIRTDLEGKTARRIEYLKQTLNRTSHPEHKRALTQLLMEQEQISMVLAVHEPFAATLAEPPSAGPDIAWPRKMLVFPAFMFAGALAAYLLYTLRRRYGA